MIAAKTIIIACLAALGAYGAPALAGGPVDAAPPAHGEGAATLEEKVLTAVHAANRAEIEAAVLAARKSQTAAVLAFAAMMRKDHGKADRLVRATARAERMRLLQISSLGEEGRTQLREHAALMHKLRSLEGRAFDKAYMAAQVKAHAQVAKNLAHAIEELPAGATRDLLEKLLPTVRKHGVHAARILRAL